MQDKDLLVLLLNEKDSLIKEKYKTIELLEEKIKILETNNLILEINPPFKLDKTSSPLYICPVIN